MALPSARAGCADTENGPVVGDERPTDRHAALVAPDARLLDGVVEVLVVAFSIVFLSCQLRR